MRQASRREIWEAAKVVGAAAAVILLSFGIALALADAVSFPERQRVEFLANPGAAVHPAGGPGEALKAGRDPYAPPPGAEQGPPEAPAQNQ